ncbi:major facilitator superfamily domain-containing protein [Chytridium lagenaria]|nr:major facilitator superfamily domain-containing protein [Chytridium lagenaria]
MATTTAPAENMSANLQPTAISTDSPISIAADTKSAITIVDEDIHNSTSESKPIDVEAQSTGSKDNPFQGVDPDFVSVPLARTQFFLVFLGLSLSILLAALDQTIVATALEKIVKDLGSQELIPWIGSGYLLTATSVAAVYGKFADIFGRKPVFVFALIVFEVGSVICAIANNMPVLIVGRAVAGIGGGGIFSLVLIIISDIVSIADRGKYQGIVGAVFGLASVIGPLMGGAFSDNISWRWCFWINLPVPAVTGSSKEKLARVDWLGTIILFFAVSTLITPLQLGGSTWDWSAPQTIAMFVIGLILTAIFIYVEMRRPALLAVAFCLGSGFFSAVYYISLFFQVSYGQTATQAGLQTIPLILGLVFLSITSGQVLSRTGYYLPFLYVGPVILSAGVALISTLTASSSSAQQILYLLIAVSAQAASSKSFSQSLGGTFGVAITGTIFNNVLADNIKKNPALVAVLNGADPAKVNLPILREVLAVKNPALLTQLVEAFVSAFQIAYRGILPFTIMIFLLAFLVKQYVMKTAKNNVGMPAIVPLADPVQKHHNVLRKGKGPATNAPAPNVSST